MSDVLEEVLASGAAEGLVDASSEAGRLVVHWHGDVPPDVRALLDGAPFDVAVVHARYRRATCRPRSGAGVSSAYPLRFSWPRSTACDVG